MALCIKNNKYCWLSAKFDHNISHLKNTIHCAGSKYLHYIQNNKLYTMNKLGRIREHPDTFEDVVDIIDNRFGEVVILYDDKIDIINIYEIYASYKIENPSLYTIVYAQIEQEYMLLQKDQNTYVLTDKNLSCNPRFKSYIWMYNGERHIYCENLGIRTRFNKVDYKKISFDQYTMFMIEGYSVIIENNDFIALIRNPNYYIPDHIKNNGVSMIITYSNDSKYLFNMSTLFVQKGISVGDNINF